MSKKQITNHYIIEELPNTISTLITITSNSLSTAILIYLSKENLQSMNGNPDLIKHKIFAEKTEEEVIKKVNLFLDELFYAKCSIIKVG